MSRLNKKPVRRRWFAPYKPGGDNPVLYVFREPFVIRTRPLPAIRQEVPANLLPLQLAPPPQKPFFNQDWPRPPHKLPKSTSPFIAVDLVQDGPVSPFTTVDWQRNSPRLLNRQNDQQQNLLLLQQTTALTPFTKPDWQDNPTRIITRPHEVAVNLLPLAQKIAPFVLDDYSPVTAPRLPNQSIEPQRNLLPLAPKVLPFSQNDSAPVVSSRLRVSLDVAATNLLPLQLGSVVTLKPFINQEWQRPAQKLISRQPDPNNAVLSVADVRFVISSNPIATQRVRSAKQSEVPANLLPLQQTAPTQLPFVNEQPQPQRRQRSAPAEVPANLLPLQPKVGPFTQFDWPPTSRVRRAVQSEIAVNYLPLQQRLTPFRQDNFDNPARLPKTASQDGDAGGAIYFLLRQAVVLTPFIAADWPVRRNVRKEFRGEIPTNFLPIIAGIAKGTVTHRGGSGIDTHAHGAATVAASRLAASVAADRAAETAATDRGSGSTATGRASGSPATPRN